MFNIILGFIFALLPVGENHPLHVSVTEINYDEKDKALEIMSRVFMDDLETSLKSRFNQPDLDILNPKNLTIDQMMAEYVKEHLAITLDKKPLQLNYLGHEQEGEAFIFFVEVSKVKKWKNISVANTFLMEAFEDQSNLVHVTSQGSVKSLRLNKKNPHGDLFFP
jgi:hypothetical protein